MAAPEPPAKPTGLSAAAVSHDAVTLTWDNPQDDSITGYVILRRDREIHPGGTFVTIAGDTGSADTTYTDDTVEPDKEYVYRIKAINEHGEVSQISNWVRADTPAVPVPDKPTGLSAAVSHDTVTLTWDDPQDDSITGYVILRRDRAIHPGGTFVTIAGDTGSTDTTYIDAAVEPDKEYVYRIKAINEHGEVSEMSNWVRGFTPAAPQPDSPATGEPTIRGTARVGEMLTADTSGIADADGLTNVTYSYQWLVDDTDIAGATSSTYTLAETDEGQTIKVRVIVTDDAENETTLASTATAVVAAPEPPAKPTGLSAAVSHDVVTLTWDDPQDDSITGYVILRRDREIHPTGTFVTITGDTGSTDTTYTDETVEPDEQYVYRIKAINEHGEVSEESDWVRANTPAVPVPDKPTGLSTVVSYNTVTLTWDDPQDDAITGYVILRRDRAIHPKGTFVTIAGDTGSAQTAYTDETVEPDKQYVYRIKAINEHGEVSEESDWVRADTPAAPAPAG